MHPVRSSTSGQWEKTYRNILLNFIYIDGVYTNISYYNSENFIFILNNIIIFIKVLLSAFYACLGREQMNSKYSSQF